MALNTLELDIVQDFTSECLRYKRSVDDFEVTPSPMRMADPRGISPVIGSVTVKDRKSGIEREYPAGHGATFPADFGRDLKAGVFG